METKDRIFSRIFPIFASATLVSAVACLSMTFGQTTYAYRDEAGVLVLTNIAPSRPVKDLKVYGIPQIAPAAPPKSTTASAGTKKGGRLVPTKPLPKQQSAELMQTSYSSPNNVVELSGPPPSRPELGPIIEKYAKEFRLDPKLVQSVIATESGFTTHAVSPKGALGLMQLMPSTAARLGVRDPFDPEQNIRGGAKHLRFLLDTFGHLDLSLAAYNAGENLVQRLGRIPNIRETRDYVKSVTARYGAKEMKDAFFEQPSPAYPPVFRFLDRNGVLVITNIPPVERSASGLGSSPAGQVQSPH